MKTENSQEFAERVIEDHGDMVYRLALSQTKNQALAEDLFQEVFLRLMQQERSFENEEHLKAWLIRVTVNAGHKFFRSAFWRKTVPLEEITSAEQQNQFDFAEQSEVYQAVLGLPKKYRAVIHLYYYEGYSQDEIAKILGLAPATVRSQMFRARNLLKQRLGGNEHHEECKGEV